MKKLISVLIILSIVSVSVFAASATNRKIVKETSNTIVREVVEGNDGSETTFIVINPEQQKPDPEVIIKEVPGPKETIIKEVQVPGPEKIVIKEVEKEVFVEPKAELDENRLNKFNISVLAYLGGNLANIRQSNVLYKYIPINPTWIYAGFEVAVNNFYTFGKMSGLGAKIAFEYDGILKEGDTYGALISKYGATAPRAYLNEFDTSLAFMYNLTPIEWVQLNFNFGMFVNSTFPARQTFGPQYHSHRYGLGYGFLLGMDANFFATDLLVVGISPIYRYEVGHASQIRMHVSIGVKF